MVLGGSAVDSFIAGGYHCIYVLKRDRLQGLEHVDRRVLALLYFFGESVCKSLCLKMQGEERNTAFFSLMEDGEWSLEEKGMYICYEYPHTIYRTKTLELL